MHKVLFLCNRNYYLTKMSRVRFHSMEAISKITDFKWSGLNWENYNENLTARENIDNLYKNEDKPDIVVAYKPLDVKGFAGIEQKTCIRYNEMYEVPWTLKEINEAKPDVIVCHHLNDMKQYEGLHDFKMVNIPHCAEKSIFYDQKLDRTFDVMLVGALGTQTIFGDHYPLRSRIYDLLKQMNHKYKCGVLPHPGGDHNDAYTDKYAKEFARVLNTTKIAVTCSGKPRSRYGKYVEIPMCGTAIAADIPNEDQVRFKNFVIEINMEMTDQEIIDKLSYYIDNENDRQMKKQIGMAWSQQYTQEKYAKKFIRILENI